jgi:hypothetical protein
VAETLVWQVALSALRLVLIGTIEPLEVLGEAARGRYRPPVGARGRHSWPVRWYASAGAHAGASLRKAVGCASSYGIVSGPVVSGPEMTCSAQMVFPRAE